VGVRGAGAHFCRHPDRFHDFFGRRATAGRSLGVTADAIGALRDVSCGYGYQLLGLGGQCPVGENQVTEVRERIVYFRRKLLAVGAKAGSGLGKYFSRHDDSPGFFAAYRLAARVALEAATIFMKD
jgi:hypothetical protein